ncbi:redoxin domain-containing protein [Loktanella sp. 5RATIMAR09]|uniref:redoxin domain-containing protein n=1 Tax=Loktanella sp. 5RATIMAR09 TaxID=1225655 RepID=UPI0006EB422A|nr:redoxin domain-containing protein [Loktanella sp. 5RATIMAR09]
MGIHSYFPWQAKANRVQIPFAKRKTNAWQPRVGDIFPNFGAPTTQGNLDFWEWAEGSWVHVFNQPDLPNSVCSGELVSFARKSEAWAKRGIKVLALSNMSLIAQVAWQRDVKERCGCEVRFPIVADEAGLITQALGMRQEHGSVPQTLRRSFILAPNLKIRMMLDYPEIVDRSPDEILRVINVLQATEQQMNAVPTYLPIN